MLIQIIFSLLIGILFGTFTGLIPGIHINLVGVFLVSLSATIFSSINPIFLVVFVVAMAITHTFLDFIPSVFLGCPDTDTELSILPGHELLKQGHGYEAVVLTAYGSLVAVFIIILITYPAIWLIPKIYNLAQKIIPFILITTSIILIYFEKNKISALLAFVLTGLLGLSVLNLPNLKEPLLPLLTGLFGSSMLITSVKNKTRIPEQKIPEKIKPKLSRPIFSAIISSPLCGFLPGLGAGQAAIIGNQFMGKEKTNPKNFLVLLGITNTLVMSFSLITLYAISRTRTGAAIAVQNIIGKISGKMLILIIIIILLSGIISFFLTIKITKIISTKISKINYTKISIITLTILIMVVFLISGVFGLIILAISTATGIFCISLNVRKTQMMGCLLIPTILFYLA